MTPCTAQGALAGAPTVLVVGGHHGCLSSVLGHAGLAESASVRIVQLTRTDVEGGRSTVHQQTPTQGHLSRRDVPALATSVSVVLRDRTNIPTVTGGGRPGIVKRAPMLPGCSIIVTRAVHVNRRLTKKMKQQNSQQQHQHHQQQQQHRTKGNVKESVA